MVRLMQIAAHTLAQLIPFDAEQQLPQRVKILNWGDNPNTKGVPCRVNELTVQVLPGNQAKAGFDRVALDYEHNTLPGSKAFQESTEPRRVAAFGVVQVVPGDGVYLADLAWTPDGLKNARNFTDYSPVPLTNSDGVVVAIHSAALCRQGSIYGLHAFAVELETETLEGVEADMDIEKLKTDLGLDALAQQIADLAAKMEALTGKAPKADEKLEAMNTNLETLTGKLDSMVNDTAARLDAFERQTVLHGARLEGKVLPMSQEHLDKLDLEGLKDLVAKTKPSVPLTQKTPDNVQAFSVGAQTDEAQAKADARAKAIAAKAQEMCGADKTLSFSAAWDRAAKLFPAG